MGKTRVRIKRRLRPAINRFYSLRNAVQKRAIPHALSAYWYPENNFGDQLTPDILRHFGLKPLYSPVFEKCDVLCVGSILDIVPESYSGYILGAGFINESAELQFPWANIGLVRGKLTAGKLNLPESFPVGDPGIIVDEVYEKEIADVKKLYRVGIVPHYLHLQSPPVINLQNMHGAELKLIDVRRKPVDVIRNIASCEHIISSSLHGLIVAHSLGIPTLAIEIDQAALRGGRFKFNDYYSAYGQEPNFRVLRGDEALNDLCTSTEYIESSMVDAIKTNVRNSYLECIRGIYEQTN